MSGVIGLTELLLDTTLDEEQRMYAQALSNSGEVLMTVIDGILDFAKIESGKVEVEDVEFSLRKVIDDVIGLMAPAAKAKSLALSAVLEDSSHQS